VELHHLTEYRSAKLRVYCLTSPKGVIGPYLSPRDRLDIIEYMKVMRTVPPLPSQELERRMTILHEQSNQYEEKPAYQQRPVVVN
jgi:hypothetical protein